MEFPWPPVAFLVVFLSFGYLLYRGGNLAESLDRRRTKFIQDYAATIGWEFKHDEGGAEKVVTRLSRMKAFAKGKDGQCCNQLRGRLRVKFDGGMRRNFEALAGDFSYTDTDNDSSTKVLLSYILVRLPTQCRNELHITKRVEGDLVDLAASAVGLGGIGFETDDFNECFWVASDDKKFAYDVVHPRMMEFLLGSPITWIEIRDGFLCIVSRSRRLRFKLPHADATRKDRWKLATCLDLRWNKHQVPEMLRHTADFLALWPRHLHTS